MMESDSQTVRQRRIQEREAMKDKVENMKLKMKQTETSQQRWNSAMRVLIPLLLLVVVLAGLYFLYHQVILNNNDVKKPLEMNSNIEPNEMKESMIEEVDDTEDLYLEL